MRKINTDKYSVIDLFSGAGGLSRGFQDSGFKVLLGIDNDTAALETFEKNHSGAKAVNLDLSSNDAVGKVIDLIDGKEVDVIVAGPPCQGFSLSGPRNFDDERNKLYLSVIHFVDSFKPKAFIIENVPGMATLYNGEVKQEIIHRFEKMGYNIDSKILLASDFGVPQNRRRLIFMGIRKDLGNPIFPKRTHTPDDYVTCREAISDLPSLTSDLGTEITTYVNLPKTKYQKKMRSKSNKLFNHVGTKHTQLVIDTIALVPEGGNYKDLPEGWGESRKFNEAWTRYHGDKPSKTIDTGHRNHFHYEYNRIPTVRENARLQSFSDDFVFYGNKTQQYRQVGNAVPPLLGYALANQIKNILEEAKDEKN